MRCDDKYERNLRLGFKDHVIILHDIRPRLRLFRRSAKTRPTDKLLPQLCQLNY